jgi:hypothetical protein
MKGVKNEVVRHYYNGFGYTYNFVKFQQNTIYSHGICTALGLNIPTPYFLQELILGMAASSDIHASLVRLFVSLEISERDEIFVASITDGIEEWWDGTQGPFRTYDEFCELIKTRMEKVAILFPNIYGCLHLIVLRCMKTVPWAKILL